MTPQQPQMELMPLISQHKSIITQICDAEEPGRMGNLHKTCHRHQEGRSQAHPNEVL